MKWLMLSSWLLATLIPPVEAQAQDVLAGQPRQVADQIVCPLENLEWGIAETFPDPWYGLTYVETTAADPYTMFWKGKEMIACSYSYTEGDGWFMPGLSQTPSVPGGDSLATLYVVRPYVDVPEDSYPCPPTIQVSVLSELPSPWLGTTYPWSLTDTMSLAQYNVNACKYEGVRAKQVVRPVITDYPDITSNPPAPIDDLTQVFGVTSAQLAAIPAQKTTACPTTVRFEGSIRTSGPGEVRYRFEVNGQAGSLKTLDFDAAIGQPVWIEVQVGAPPAQAAIGGLAAARQPRNVVTGQARIVIESPSEGVSESNTASYEITCSPAAAGNVAQAPTMPARRQTPAPDHDALNAARFSITIDGVEVAQFAELVSINTRANPPTITLKRGTGRGRAMWVWHEAARLGDVAARKSASLVFYNYEGQTVARYHIENAWPSQMEIGDVKAREGEMSYETVTLTAEDIQRVAP